MNVRFTSRSRRKLVVSWNEPDTRIWSGKATRYEFCYSTKERDSRPQCEETNRFLFEISSLQPAKKYFVTVSAGTREGFGPKSAEISKITNRGMNLAWPRFRLFYCFCIIHKLVTHV